MSFWRAAVNTTGPAVDRIPAAGLSFTDAADRYLRRVDGNLKSAATIAGALRRFQREWGDRPLAGITSAMIESWQYARLQQRTRVGQRLMSKSGVNRELAMLSAFFGWAWRNDLVPANPCERVKLFPVRNRRLVALTDDQSAALLAACTGRRRHLYPIVLMAINTGMRRGELLRLRWADVNLEAGTVWALETKNGEARDVPLLPSLAAYLRRARGAAPAEALVFRHADGTPFRSVASSWRAACSDAGIPHAHLHDLRHTFASRLLQTGADVAVLQEIMGHKTAAMSLRYAHAFALTKRAAMDRMDGMNRAGTSDRNAGGIE